MITGKRNTIKNRYTAKNRHSTKKMAEIKKDFQLKIIKTDCPDINECLMIGKKREEIIKLFHNFDLKYAYPYLVELNTNSFNSYIYQVKFHTGNINHNYNSYGIIKSVRGEGYDNLQYEYMIGKYLNEINKNIPCFIETYSLLKLNNKYNIDEYIVKEKKENTVTGIRKKLLQRKYTQKGTKLNTQIAGSPNNQVKLSDIFVRIHGTVHPICDTPRNYGLLIQNVYNSRTFKYVNELLKYSSEHFQSDIPAIVFQIYFSLYSMFKNNKDFVHQDLHLENVMLYRVPNGIHYEFIVGRNKISFKSKYLVKIIDYSRSYCIQSPSFYDKVKMRCKRKFGFFLHNEPIDYLNPNVSIDLRLLNQLKNYANLNKDHLFEGGFNKLLQDVVFDGNGLTVNIPKIVENPVKIHNIFEAFERLCDYMLSDTYKKIQEKYIMNTSLKLTIHDDFKKQMIVEQN
jgi:hypothetical protein